MRDKQTGLQQLRPAPRDSLLAPKVHPTHRTLLTNVRSWSAGQSAPAADRRDQVLIVGNRIAAVAIGGAVEEEGGEIHQRIDGGGRVLMPGLIDGHAHLSFHDITRLEDAGDLPPEENLLWTQYNARNSTSSPPLLVITVNVL